MCTLPIIYICDSVRDDPIIGPYPPPLHEELEQHHCSYLHKGYACSSWLPLICDGVR